MSRLQRRDFFRTGMCAALAGAVPRGPRARVRLSSAERSIFVSQADPVLDPAAITLYDPRVRALATRALEAAHDAGAHYADVRCTNTMWRSYSAEQDVSLELSVRALVNGYWGWASTTVLSPAEAARVGQLGAQLATEAAMQGRPRIVDLGTVPVVRNGIWKTPLEIDPFDLELNEIYDWLRGMVTYLTDRRIEVSIGMDRAKVLYHGFIGIEFTREERLFASSDGSLTTQTISRIYPQFTVKYNNAVLLVPGFNRLMQGGWECLARHSNDEIYALVQAACDAADRQPAFSSKPVELGRYDVVYSAAAVADVLGNTLVPATELDRAMGYEANASGTSYLGPDPLARLGTAVASPAVTVMGERSDPHAVATAKWDDEGVVTEPFPLVNGGVLVDYQTTREQAAWLAPWYQKQGHPVRSRGCARAPTAGYEPMQHTPNIVLQPSAGNADEEALIKEMTHGLFVPRMDVHMDFQRANGFGVIPSAFEIRNGHRVAAVYGLGTLFQSTEFWKNVHAVGGAASAEWFDGNIVDKGNPNQRTSYSISAPPVLVTQQAIVDPTRKA